MHRFNHVPVSGQFPCISCLGYFPPCSCKPLVSSNFLNPPVLAVIRHVLPLPTFPYVLPSHLFIVPHNQYPVFALPMALVTAYITSLTTPVRQLRLLSRSNKPTRTPRECEERSGIPFPTNLDVTEFPLSWYPLPTRHGLCASRVHGQGIKTGQAGRAWSADLNIDDLPGVERKVSLALWEPLLAC